MLNFSQFSILTENFNQLKSLVKKNGSLQVDNGYGTPNGIPIGNDDYEFLAVLISPDEDNKEETNIELYGNIPVNSEKERTLRPFLGMLGKMYYEEKCGLDIIKIITNWIIVNKQTLNRLVLKNNSNNETYNLTNLLDIFKYQQKINDGRTAYEILTDAIRDKGGIDKLKDWINKMPSQLRNGFKNENSYKELYTLVNSYDSLSDNDKSSIWISLFGDGVKKGKISRFQSADQFLKALKIDIKNHQEDYNIDIVKGQILNTKGAKLIVCDYEKGYVVADIWDYSASNKLGEVNNWCISYNSSYWYDTYMNYKVGNKMFFIWNFNAETSDPHSHMGLCVKSNGSMRAFHDKYDKSIDLEVLYKYDIDIDFITNEKYKVSEEEYKYKEKSYIKTTVINKGFSRYESNKEESLIKADTFISMYNEDEIEESDLVKIFDSVFKISDIDIKFTVLNRLLNDLNLTPTNTGNKLLCSFLNSVNFNNHTTEKSQYTEHVEFTIKKLYSFDSISTDYINNEAFDYLKMNHKNIYEYRYSLIKKALRSEEDIDNESIIQVFDDLIINDIEYNSLLEYIIKHNKVGHFIIDIFKKRTTIINDLIKRNYKFSSFDISEFLETYNYDLSDIKIDSEYLDMLVNGYVKSHSIIENIDNLEKLFTANDKKLYEAIDDLEKLKFFVHYNNVPLSKLKWHLNITKQTNSYSGYSNEQSYLEENKSINIYTEYKNGNLSIKDNSFYYKHIIKHIFENDLDIENTEEFLQSLINNNQYKNIPLKYINSIIDLTLKYNRKIPTGIAHIAIKNNIGNIDKIIDNLEYSEDYDYKSGNTSILNSLLSFNHSYIDKIISKLPNIEKYDMDDVGIYIKNVAIINKLLDVCEKPKDKLIYYILYYAYDKDNTEGDIGDNDETIMLIDRLLKIGNKFKFDINSNYDSYFIFEKLSLYLLKIFNEKKYFKISELDNTTTARNILKNNDYELYIYFKSIGIVFGLEFLKKGQKREIIEDILKTKEADFNIIFSHVKNADDFIYFYDKFYHKMNVSEKSKVINLLLSYWMNREEWVITALNHIIKYDENRKFISDNWEENKRRKNYTTHVRDWIKNYLYPPKIKIKKFNEMFNISYLYITKKLNETH